MPRKHVKGVKIPRPKENAGAECTVEGCSLTLSSSWSANGECAGCRRWPKAQKLIGTTGVFAMDYGNTQLPFATVFAAMPEPAPAIVPPAATVGATEARLREERDEALAALSDARAEAAEQREQVVRVRRAAKEARGEVEAEAAASERFASRLLEIMARRALGQKGACSVTAMVKATGCNVTQIRERLAALEPAIVASDPHLEDDELQSDPKATFALAV